MTVRAMCSLFAVSTALTTAALAQAPIPVAPLMPAPTGDRPVAAMVQASPTRAIDLVLCLDTSQSMNGLIDSARQHLWSIVNEMATLKPQPELRVGVIAYGTPAYGLESGFVTVMTGLTGDLDLVSQKLFALQTHGGQEYVARAMRRALDDLEWTADAQALKMIVVAGNEPATQDPAHDVAAVAKEAITGGVLVNTIYCGDQQKPEADGWRKVAQLADGRFAAIEQNDLAVVETPFDKELAALSGEINGTYVVYGAQAGAWAANQVAQDQNAIRMNPAAAAQRCVTKGSVLYCNPMTDLVDACKNPEFVLSSVPKEQLPEALRTKTVAELKEHVQRMGERRAELQTRIAELGRKRNEFAAVERAKRGDTRQQQFEAAMLESIRSQAAARGFERQATQQQEQQQEKEESAVDERFVERILAAVRGYERFARVTGHPRVAPEDCRMPGPYARTSQAEREHGGKLYVLYARFADGGEYLRPGVPAKVGQTLVKESWQKVDGLRDGPTEADRRYPLGLMLTDDGGTSHAGDALGLYVMHKLEPGTEGTDDGWIYGTVDRNGRVTAAGRVASCIQCHEDASEDRRFGLH